MMRQFFFLSVLVCLLTACQTHQLPTAATTTGYRMDMGQSVSEDHPLIAIIAPYKMALDEQMNEVIGESADRLYKQKPESSLGNWMADAIQRQASLLSRRNVHASVQNYGGIRIPELPAGAITLGKMYELMPFDNKLVIIDMPGKVAQRFFDLIAANGGWPVSSEVQFVLRDDKAKRLTINRGALLVNEVYRIALPDYIANGGDSCDFLGDLPREDTGVLIRDLLIEEVRVATAAGKLLDAKVTGRIAWSGVGNE